jgi:hypothetical protein
MWSELLHSKIIIPLFALTIFSTVSITPIIYYFAQRTSKDRRAVYIEDLLKRDEIVRDRVYELDARVTKLEAANSSLRQQLDILSSQLTQVIALTSGKEKKQ